MGSDTISKRELSSDVLLQADIVVTDSRLQSKERGEIYQASKDGFSVVAPIKIIVPSST